MDMSKMGNKKMQKRVPGIVEIHPDKSENAHGNH
jgi:hypothetical protein